VDEGSSVDALPMPAGQEDPSTGSVAEGATGVAIGEGTTVVVSGTEDPGEASVSHNTEESSMSAPATANRPCIESSTGSDKLGSTLLGKELMRCHRLLVNWRSEGDGSTGLPIGSASTRTPKSSMTAGSVTGVPTAARK
jgi:hypothetical protein